jgi:hypothetical protein
MRSSLLSAAVALISMAAVPAQAQETAPPAADAAPAAAEPLVVQSAVATDCELHVWPAERFSAQTTGWLSGFGMVGALMDASGHAEGDKARRTQMASALDPDGQILAMRSLDLSKLLGGKPANIIFHPVALERKTVGKVKTRRAASQSPCYSEVIVLDVMYQKAAIYGRSLRTLIWYRDFGTSQTKAAFTHRGQGGNGLKLFPAKEGEDVQAANDELVGVFKANFTEFANNVRKSPRK